MPNLMNCKNLPALVNLIDYPPITDSEFIQTRKIRSQRDMPDLISI